MAFCDANGKILIDEQAANKDVTTLKSVQKNLESVKDLLNEVLAMTGELEGNVASGIVESTQMFLKTIAGLHEESIQMQDNIIKVVNKYQEEDRLVKEHINVAFN